MRVLSFFLLVVLCLIGCGGSGGGSHVATTPVKLSVFWDERSRTVNAPSSALSGILTMTGPGNSGLTFTFNRMADPAGGLQQITTDKPITVGEATFQIRFMSQADGLGDEVARAAGTAKIAADGTGLGTVTTVQNVTRVAVVPNQTILEDEARSLDASAFNSKGETVAISPASVFWSVASNPDRLTFEDGIATGRKRGNAGVVATVDRIASPVENVFVSFEARAIQIQPVGGGDGITFVNALTPDGTVAVGTTRSTSAIQGFRWTEATGTVGLGTPAGYTGASAFGVNSDGSVIVGTASNDDGSTIGWKWTTAGGLELLPLPEGFVNSEARAVSGDGSTIVGSAFTSDGDSMAIAWINGGPPMTIIDGQAMGITRDGTQIIGFGPSDQPDKTIAWKWYGAGYFTTFFTLNPDVYLAAARAVSLDGSVVGGSLSFDGEAIPGFWTPSTSVTQINGGIGTDVYAMSGDGKLMGGGAPESGIAFYWTATAGLQNFARYLGEKGLLDEFNGIGPGTINGISDDKSRFAVTAYPGGGQSAPPRAFIVETPDFMDR